VPLFLLALSFAAPRGIAFLPASEAAPLGEMRPALGAPGGRDGARSQPQD